MKTKPVVLHTGHQAIRDGDVVDAQYVDVAAFISRDSGNALTYADGLYYAAAPCHENSSYVIATDFFPIIAEDGYKVGGLRVTGINATGGKEEARAQEAITVAVEPLGGVLRRYGMKQHAEREAVSVDVEPLGGAVRRIGLITHETRKPSAWPSNHWAARCGVRMATGRRTATRRRRCWLKQSR